MGRPLDRLGDRRRPGRPLDELGDRARGRDDPSTSSGTEGAGQEAAEDAVSTIRDARIGCPGVVMHCPDARSHFQS
ncbi:hypothetical protein GCM10009806_23470 [Microbacterium flavum]